MVSAAAGMYCVEDQSTRMLSRSSSSYRRRYSTVNKSPVDMPETVYETVEDIPPYATTNR